MAGRPGGQPLPNTLETVKTLISHPAFELTNPNKVYSLLRVFGANLVRFNAADGSGYDFMAKRIIELDAMNPQVASRLARSFDRWRKFDPARQAHARVALEQILNCQGLSGDVSEVTTKLLA
jgi:aminopeptidase N